MPDLRVIDGGQEYDPLADRRREQSAIAKDQRNAGVAGMHPPHDLKAEAAVISAEILEEDAYDKIKDILSPDDFYADAHSVIQRGIEALRKADAKVDVITVYHWIRVNGYVERVGQISYLMELCDATPAVANLRAHAEIVRLHAVARRLIAEMWRMRAELYTGRVHQKTLVEWPKQAAAIVKELEGGSIVTIADVLDAEHEQAQTKEKLPPVSSGIAALDALTTGFHGAEWTLVGARTSDGKSTLAMTVAYNVAGAVTGYRSDGAELRQNGVLIFATESGMKPQIYTTRIAAMHAGVNLERFRARTDTEEDRARLAWAKDVIRKWPIAFEHPKGGVFTPAQIQVKTMRALHDMARVGVKLRLVIIDLLSDIEAKGETLERGANEVQRRTYVGTRIDAMMGLDELKDTHLLATTQIDEKEEYPKNCKALKEKAFAYLVIRRKQKPDADDLAAKREPVELYLDKNRMGTRRVSGYCKMYSEGCYFGD